MDFKQLLVENLPLIERVVRHIGRQRSLSVAEIEDLASAVKLKLIENDYAALRIFEGRSSLATFLIVVVRRIYLDQYLHEQGRWRPSVQARKLGDAAVLLEQCLHRDGLDSEDAARCVRDRYRDLDTRAIDDLRQQLPRRPGRSLFTAAPHASSTSGEEHLLSFERQKLAQAASRALTECLAELSPEDRLIMKLRFEDGLKLSTIATALHIDAKALYRRVGRLMHRLRERLVIRGIGPAEAAELLRSESELLDVPFSGLAEDDQDRPDSRFGQEAAP
jgi:RNA polymerase sigma factor (sigma-70 family)